MVRGRSRRVSAALAVVALAWTTLPSVARAEVLASWSGRVFQSDRATPRPDVVVSLFDAGGARVVRSAPSSADGTFTLEVAAADAYGLRVEAPEGVFVAAEPVRLVPGSNPPTALALSAFPVHAKNEQGLGQGDPSRVTEYVMAGIVSLAALLVILEITDEEDEAPASVF
jgi:hypothetical protein